MWCFAVFSLQFSCKPPSLKSADISVPVEILHFKGLLIWSPPSLSLYSWGLESTLVQCWPVSWVWRCLDTVCSETTSRWPASSSRAVTRAASTSAPPHTSKNMHTLVLCNSDCRGDSHTCFHGNLLQSGTSRTMLCSQVLLWRSACTNEHLCLQTFTRTRLE